MIILFRILMMMVGYVWACLAASLVLTLGTLTPEWGDLSAALGTASPDVQSAALWTVVAVGAVVIGVVAFLPSALAIALTEGFGLRSVVVYGIIGGALALVTAYGLDFGGYAVHPDGDLARDREVFAASGIAGGLVYWLFAGRRAGLWA
jgi:hypothetical protein